MGELPGTPMVEFWIFLELLPILLRMLIGDFLIWSCVGPATEFARSLNASPSLFRMIFEIISIEQSTTLLDSPLTGVFFRRTLVLEVCPFRDFLEVESPTLDVFDARVTVDFFSVFSIGDSPKDISDGSMLDMSEGLAWPGILISEFASITLTYFFGVVNAKSLFFFMSFDDRASAGDFLAVKEVVLPRLRLPFRSLISGLTPFIVLEYASVQDRLFV